MHTVANILVIPVDARTATNRTVSHHWVGKNFWLRRRMRRQPKRRIFLAKSIAGRHALQNFVFQNIERNAGKGRSTLKADQRYGRGGGDLAGCACVRRCDNDERSDPINVWSDPPLVWSDRPLVWSDPLTTSRT